LIGLDTNVVISYLVQDDKKQSAAANRFIEKSLTTDAPGYINHISLCEIVWVIQRCYDVTRPQVREIIEGLLTTKQFTVENVEVTWKALLSIWASRNGLRSLVIPSSPLHCWIGSCIIATSLKPAMTTIGSRNQPSTPGRRAILVKDKILGYTPAHLDGSIFAANKHGLYEKAFYAGRYDDFTT